MGDKNELPSFFEYYQQQQGNKEPGSNGGGGVLGVFFAYLIFCITSYLFF